MKSITTSNGVVTNQLVSLLVLFLCLLSHSPVANAQQITPTQALYVVSVIGLVYIIVFIVILIITCCVVKGCYCFHKKGRICPSSQEKNLNKKNRDYAVFPLDSQLSVKTQETTDDDIKITPMDDVDSIDDLADGKNPAYSSQDSSSTDSDKKKTDKKNTDLDSSIVLANLSATDKGKNYFEELEKECDDEEYDDEEDNSLTMM